MSDAYGNVAKSILPDIYYRIERGFSFSATSLYFLTHGTLGDYDVLMKTQFYSAKVVRLDAKDKPERRFRNILANSGEIMESGEIRAINDLYVMDRDGKLLKVADLNTDPDKQTEDYAVKAQADHGQMVDGEPVPSMEKQFGSCKVWLEEDGLHARMYFADNDPLADHAWAISEDASYSTGIDWYPDGYYGAGYVIEEPIGILREISMVLTGNDPRAKTIDSKSDEAEGVDKAAKSTDGVINANERKSMPKKLDALTPDEREAMGRELAEVLDRFTTDAPEGETQPTARDTKDDVEGEAEKPAEAPAEPKEEPKVDSKKDTLHMPIINIVKKTDAKQEKVASAKDWRTSKDALQTFAKLAGKYQKFDGAFHAEWRSELAKHNASTNDGITGLSLPVDGRQLFINAIENGTTDSVRILSHFRNLGGKSYLIQLIEAVGAATGAETARAHGFTKGNTKVNQELTATPRSIYNKMVYKRLDLDALEVAENPELVQIRAEELVNLWFAEIARAAVIGDGRTAPAEGQPDYRMFDGTRGFYSIVADAAATEGFGAAMATAIQMAAGKNLYDASIEADAEIKAEGRLVYIMKSSALKAYRQALKTNGDYVVAPGARVEDSLNALAVYTPGWMDFADVDVVVFANNQYGLTGQANPTMRPDFDTSVNQDILLVEGPRGGSLIARKAAATITFATE